MSSAQLSMPTILPRIEPQANVEQTNSRMNFHMTIEKALQSIMTAAMIGRIPPQSSNTLILPQHLSSLLNAPIQPNVCPEQIELAVINAITKLFPRTQLSIQGQLTINTSSTNSVTVDFYDNNEKPSVVNNSPEKSASSKRKSYQPTKYHYSCNTSPVAHHNSNSTSPSVDSGALDLSRASSTTDSAPMTPIKDLQASPTYEQSFNEILSQLPKKQYVSQYKIARKRTLNRFAPLSRRLSSARRFSCNQCTEEFTSLGSLEQHTISAHAGYRCHICQAEFTQRSNLQRHALKHVGFKPFECRVCTKAYYRKDHLMRHMEMGHPDCSPRENINVFLTSSESLDYLNKERSAKTDSETRPLIVDSPLSVKIPTDLQMSDMDSKMSENSQ